MEAQMTQNSQYTNSTSTKTDTLINGRDLRLQIQVYAPLATRFLTKMPKLQLEKRASSTNGAGKSGYPQVEE